MPKKKINEKKLEQTIEDSLEKTNNPSQAPTKPAGNPKGEVEPTRANVEKDNTEGRTEQKKSFRESMGPAEAFGIPCLVIFILILLFMIFLGVVVKWSLWDLGL